MASAKQLVEYIAVLEADSLAGGRSAGGCVRGIWQAQTGTGGPRGRFVMRQVLGGDVGSGAEGEDPTSRGRRTRGSFFDADVSQLRMPINMLGPAAALPVIA